MIVERERRLFGFCAAKQAMGRRALARLCDVLETAPAPMTGPQLRAAAALTDKQWRAAREKLLARRAMAILGRQTRPGRGGRILLYGKPQLQPGAGAAA